MASQTVNIALPVLLVNQGFRVEYRLESDTVYTLWGIETGNTFTVTGLTPGVCYIFKITFLSSLSPLIECEYSVKKHCIPSVINCPDIKYGLAPIGDVWQLAIEVELASPFVEPCGGYRIEYGIQPPYSNIYISSFFTSPSNNPLFLPASNDPYHVGVFLIDCEGNEIECDSTIVNPDPQECNAAVITDEELIVTNGVYQVKLTVTPTFPSAGIYYINYSQNGTVTSGIPDPGGTVIRYGTNSAVEIFYITVNPNTNVTPTNDQFLIKYNGGLVDDCRFTHKWSVSTDFFPS